MIMVTFVRNASYVIMFTMNSAGSTIVKKHVNIQKALYDKMQLRDNFFRRMQF
jgi:hypothetical protein